MEPTSSTGQQPSSEGGEQGRTGPPLEPAKTGEPTRDKIRVLIAEALQLARNQGVQGDPCAAAVDVEEAMYVQNSGVNQKYKAKYRTLAFNLKDPKNPDLRAKVSMRAAIQSLHLYRCKHLTFLVVESFSGMRCFAC